MRKLFLLLFITINCCMYGAEKADYNIPDFRYHVGDDAGIELMKHTNENPFRNPDFSWFNEDLRKEKLIIASGVIVLAAGVPFLIVGLMNLFVPNVDVTETSRTTYYVFTGLGGGLLAAGTGLTITGGVLFGIERKKLKVKLETPQMFHPF